MITNYLDPLYYEEMEFCRESGMSTSRLFDAFFDYEAFEEDFGMSYNEFFFVPGGEEAVAAA